MAFTHSHIRIYLCILPITSHHHSLPNSRGVGKSMYFAFFLGSHRKPPDRGAQFYEEDMIVRCSDDDVPLCS
jgi:hypothetical protein